MTSKILDTYNVLDIIHMNATSEDLKGNNQLGRYVFLTGCLSRAENISQKFLDRKVKTHSRGHHLYTGFLETASGEKIDVASISTGMGASSTDIIMHELFALGARRFIRVGTAGSLQPVTIKCGDVVVATAAVMDNDSAYGYVPMGFPAIASSTFVEKINEASRFLSLQSFCHQGIVHSKSSLYAREVLKQHFPENNTYMNQLKQIGICATEMECSQIFVLTSLFNHFVGNNINHPATQVKSGAILAIIGDETPFSLRSDQAEKAIQIAINIAIKAVELLALEECFK